MTLTTSLIRRAAVPILAGICALLLIAACGSDSKEEEPTEPSGQQTPVETATSEPADGGDQTSGETVDACALLSADEAEAAIGAPVGEPTQENTPPVFACSYEAAGFEGLSVVVVVFQDADQAADAFQSAIDINDYDEVSGIGERAYTSVIYDLSVLTGKYEVSIDVNPAGDGDEAELAKSVAVTVLARLP